MRTKRQPPCASMRKAEAAPTASQRATCWSSTRRESLFAAIADQLRVLGEGAAERRVIGRAVIALAVVLPHELPVALLDDGALVRDLRVGQVVRREIAGRLLGKGVEGRGVVREADVDEAGDLPAVDRLQAVAGEVEVGAHVPRPQQPAVELVRPLVIGADDLRVRSLRRTAEGRAAMPARVVKRPHDAVAAAHDHDRIEADLVDDVAAGLRELAGGHGEQPAPVPDPLEIELEDVGVRVKCTGERMIRPAAPQQRQHLGITKHFGILLAYPRGWVDRGAAPVAP